MYFFQFLSPIELLKPYSANFINYQKIRHNYFCHTNKTKKYYTMCFFVFCIQTSTIKKKTFVPFVPFAQSGYSRLPYIIWASVGPMCTFQGLRGAASQFVLNLAVRHRGVQSTAFQFVKMLEIYIIADNCIQMSSFFVFSSLLGQAASRLYLTGSKVGKCSNHGGTMGGFWFVQSTGRNVYTK